MLYSPSVQGFYLPAINGTNIPGDAVEISDVRHAELLAGQTLGKIISPGPGGFPILLDPPPPLIPSFEQKVLDFQRQVQKHIDAQAIALGYDDAATAITYAEEPAVPKFQNEGRALRAWRSLVWQACYALLAQVGAGAVPEPTLEQVIAALPQFIAPGA